MKVLEKQTQLDSATELLREAFDMLEEDLEEEQFFVTVRRAYWAAAEGSPARKVATALIQRLAAGGAVTVQYAGADSLTAVVQGHTARYRTMLEWDERMERVLDDTFLLLFNGGPEPVSFTLPLVKPDVSWEVMLSTADPGIEAGTVSYPCGTDVDLAGRSVTVLRRLDNGGALAGATAEPTQ